MNKLLVWRPLRHCWLTLLLLTGCASQLEHSNQSSGQPKVQQLAAAAQVHVAPLDPALRQAVQTEVQQLLQTELSLSTVAKIAVLNNAAFQAQLARLQLSEATLQQAGLLPNPGLRLIRSKTAAGYETELDVSFDLFALLFRPAELVIADHQAQQQQLQVALQLVDLLSQSRGAWVEAVVAEQQLQYLTQVQQAIDASAELAVRMYQAGNYSALQQARAQKFAAEVALQLAQAQQQQIRSRERLFRLLGLWGEQLTIQLPAQLPAIPATLAAVDDAEQQALQQRLDLQLVKAQLAQQSAQLKLTGHSRFLRGLSLEVEGSVQHSDSRAVAIGIELPLFDQHQARMSQAEARYLQAYWQAQALAVQARSEVRESYALLQSQHQIALHYQQQLLPLAKKINAENVLRYNGMLIGVFELIADTQAQVATVLGQFQAQRNFALAQLQFEQSLLGSPAIAAALSESPPAAAAAVGH